MDELAEAGVLQPWQQFGGRASYEIELAKVIAGLDR
jgi:hypothetical protein